MLTCKRECYGPEHPSTAPEDDAWQDNMPRIGIVGTTSNNHLWLLLLLLPHNNHLLHLTSASMLIRRLMLMQTCVSKVLIRSSECIDWHLYAWLTILWRLRNGVKLWRRLLGKWKQMFLFRIPIHVSGWFVRHPVSKYVVTFAVAKTLRLKPNHSTSLWEN